MIFKIRTALAVIIPLAAYATVSAQDAAKPGLTVSPQAAGSTVTIDAATIPADGWLVIHAINGGKPVVPGSLGDAPVKAGANTAVTVTLSEPAKPGTKVLAMLHGDTGETGVYEFGPDSVSEDKPLFVDGKPVVKPVAIQ